MQITKYGAGDEDRVVELLKQFKDQVLSTEAVADFLKSESNYLLGAYADGEPAGLALAYWLQRPDGKADMLFLYEIEVAKAFRRRGVARQLIEQMKGDASGKFFVLTEESNEPAMHLYESCGGRRLNPDDVLFALGPVEDDG